MIFKEVDAAVKEKKKSYVLGSKESEFKIGQKKYRESKNSESKNSESKSINSWGTKRRKKKVSHKLDCKMNTVFLLILSCFRRK